MPDQSGKSGVVCPFYMCSHGLGISCEAPMPDALRVEVLFTTRAAYRLQFYEYCCTQTYRFCEIYRMTLAAKYEEE